MSKTRLHPRFRYGALVLLGCLVGFSAATWWHAGQVARFQTENEALHRLALLALAALYDDDLEFVHRLAGSRSIEVMAEFEGDSWYGQVPDSTGEGDRKLREWLDQGERELEPPHFFIEGHGGFHNVVFRFPQGYLWVQFDDQARLSKLFAGPTDPRERL